MKDMISVIIPVYNRQAVIGECVQSVLAQSEQNFEIILIDDGSSDRTVALCEEMSRTEPRIRLLTREHGGVSAARNAGIEAARGEYVFFLDSDDVIHPRLLEALVTGLKNSDAAIAGTGIVNVPEKYWHMVKERIAGDSAPGETTYQNHQDTLKEVFFTSSPINLVGGVMMRLELIGQTRFRTDLFIGEDYYFVYQNLIKGASTVFLKQKWYYCRIHANNSSWQYDYDAFWTRFHRRELVWKSEEAFGRTEYANRQKRDAFFVYLRCLKHNKPGSADTKKMRAVMKAYRKTLLPGLSWGEKARFCLHVYVPATYLAACRVKKLLKKAG